MASEGRQTMLRLALLVALLVAPLAVTAAQCHTLDDAHGRVTFEVDQAGAPFSGAFRRFGGEVCLAGDAVASIDVHLEPASVDTGLPELDTALGAGEFFSVNEHPSARFVSDRIERTEKGFVARGTLTLKGISRPMDVAFTLEQVSDGYTVSGALVFNRLDFNVGTGQWSNTAWLGADVRVTYEARLSSKTGG